MNKLTLGIFIYVTCGLLAFGVNSSTRTVTGDRVEVRDGVGGNAIGLLSTGNGGYDLTLPTSNGSANQCIKNSGTPGTLTFGACIETDTDELAKVSANDTTSGYLNGKLVAGSNITLTENNDGGNETLTIASTSSGMNIGDAIGNSPTAFGFLAADGLGNLFNDDSYTFSGSGPVAVAMSVGKGDFTDSRSDLYARATDEANLQALCNGALCKSQVIVNDNVHNGILKMGDNGQMQLESTGNIYMEPTGDVVIRNNGNLGVGNIPGALVYKNEVYRDTSDGVYTRYANATTGRGGGAGLTVGIDSGEAAVIRSGSATRMYFGTNGLNTMWLEPADGPLVTPAGIELGDARQIGDRNSIIDFHSQDSVDYSLRLLRSPGANGAFSIVNNGVGDISIGSQGGSDIYINGSTGNIGIGPSIDTTPDAPLDIQTTDNNPIAQYSSTGLPDLYWMQLRGESAATGNYLWRVSNNGVVNDAFRIFGDAQTNISKNLFVGLNGGAAGADTIASQIISGNNANATYVGRNSAGTTTMYIQGTGQIVSQFTTIAFISDKRNKEKVRKLEYGLNEIMQLEPKRFKWKKGYADESDNQLGFMAQEVQEVMPELVFRNTKIDAAADTITEDMPKEEKLALALKTGDLIPVLVNAVKELKAEVDSLKARVDKLEAKN